MKCPSCNKNVPDNTSFCPSCGGALFGPRSIDLNEVGGKNTIQSNNIKSITGIDINDIAPISHNDYKKNSNRPNKKVNTSKSNIPWGTISLILIIIALIVLCVTLYMKTKDGNNSNCEKPIVTVPAGNCIEGIYGLTSKYAFLLPENWIYSETAKENILTNNSVSIIIYPTKKATIKVSAETIKNKYQEQGYAVVTGEESVLNQKKVIFIKFNSADMYFVDYYYQYNTDTVIYGQIISKNKNALTNEIKDIIASITPQEKTSITVGKAPVNYDTIFGTMN